MAAFDRAGGGFIMDRIDFEKIGRWLPFFASPAEIEEFSANKSLYPASVALTREVFYLDLACLREKIRQQFIQQVGPQKIVVLTKKLLDATFSPSLATLVALDALQPLDVTPIIKKVDGEEIRLGTAVCLSKVNKKKKIAAKIVCDFGKIASNAKIAPGAKKKRVEVEVPPEEIVVIPVKKDQKVVLTISCSGARLLGKKKSRVEAKGGEVGVVIDGRGRPINLLFGETESQKKVERWARVFEDKS
jgi:hypothetical protein